MSGNARPIRFGVFEVDLHTGELRRQGVRIKLRDQPFQILLLLLAHPGEVVSRDELQKQLWPGDTFVDFDRGLNKAVNHLRDALGDSAESPRFIETLPKRGYRFITSVDAYPPNGYPLEPTRETQHAEWPEPRADAQPPGARGTTRSRKLRLSTGLPWTIAGLASVVAAISGGLLWRARQPVDRPMMRFSVDLGPEAIRGRAESGEFYNPVISPDGTHLVFPAKAADGSERLAMRRLDQSIVTMLAGTEGAADPFFSPDGQWIGFFAGQKLKLKKIPIHGGAVVTLCDTAGPEMGASWGRRRHEPIWMDTICSACLRPETNRRSSVSPSSTASGPGVGRRFCPAVRMFCSPASSPIDLVVHDLQRGTVTRLTFDAALNRHPVWMLDGQHIVYGSDVPANDGELAHSQTAAAAEQQAESLSSFVVTRATHCYTLKQRIAAPDKTMAAPQTTGKNERPSLLPEKRADVGVEHVAFKAWLLHTRVIEVPFQIPPHSDSFHNLYRPDVTRRCEGENFRQLQFLESHCENGSSRFRSQPTSPERLREPPKNLHSWSEVRLKFWDR
jgi:DNA-binding winged helix-turn-helix (wHTH) protein